MAQAPLPANALFLTDRALWLMWPSHWLLSFGQMVLRSTRLHVPRCQYVRAIDLVDNSGGAGRATNGSPRRHFDKARESAGSTGPSWPIGNGIGQHDADAPRIVFPRFRQQIGRASCRERVGKYV